MGQPTYVLHKEVRQEPWRTRFNEMIGMGTQKFPAGTNTLYFRVDGELQTYVCSRHRLDRIPEEFCITTEPNLLDVEPLMILKSEKPRKRLLKSSAIIKSFTASIESRMPEIRDNGIWRNLCDAARYLEREAPVVGERGRSENKRLRIVQSWLDQMLPELQIVADYRGWGEIWKRHTTELVFPFTLPLPLEVYAAVFKACEGQPAEWATVGQLAVEAYANVNLAMQSLHSTRHDPVEMIVEAVWAVERARRGGWKNNQQIITFPDHVICGLLAGLLAVDGGTLTEYAY